ncbi:MAG TPA: hypothetical protein VFE58_03570 [Tepidisphaeraceae bacterium]|jgi:hypothetical protein|nr:hypothetical protein [Tepidisphaeraceae bacterium]
MMGLGRWRVAWAVLALALVGCQGSVPPEREVLRSLGETWRPDLLFVRARPYPRLVVEVDAVEGCEPAAETLAALREFLVRHVDKPGGVEVVVRPSVPMEVARGMRLNQLLLSTVEVPGDWKTVRQDTATIRVLFYDSRQLQGRSDEEIKPHSNGVPYPAQIYFDRAYEPVVNRGIERVALQHEVGHVLGLVGDPVRGDGAHCRNEACLMAPNIQVSWVRMVLLQREAAPKVLCAECEADLARSRASMADARVRFVGPSTRPIEGPTGGSR